MPARYVRLGTPYKDTAMRNIIVLLTILVGAVFGGGFGFILGFILAGAFGIAACSSTGFLSEDICAADWQVPIFILPMVGGLIGGGFLGNKWVDEIANWVIGPQDQATSKGFSEDPSNLDSRNNCLKCGAFLDSEGLFCTSCGAHRQDVSYSTEEDTDTPDSDLTTYAYEGEVTPSVQSPSNKVGRWLRFGLVLITLLLLIGWCGKEACEWPLKCWGDPAKEYSSHQVSPTPTATPFHTATPKGLNHFEQGEQYLWRDENYLKAVESFTEYINLNPDVASGYEKRGLSYQELKRYQEALQDYDKAIELSPENSSDIYGNRGHIYSEFGRYQEAINNYDKWLNLDHKTLWPYHYKGMAYRQLEQYDLAIQSWERYVDLRLIESANWRESEQAIHAYNNIGWAYIELRQYQEAIESFDKALSVNPDHTQAIAGKNEADKRLR